MAQNPAILRDNPGKDRKLWRPARVRKLRDEDETKWMYVFDDSLASDADYVLFLQSGHARIGIQPILDRMPNNGCFFYFDYDALGFEESVPQVFREGTASKGYLQLICGEPEGMPLMDGFFISLYRRRS